MCQGPQPELESCDFADNDCDGQVDEEFTDAQGHWTLEAHCGACWSSCEGKIAHGVGVCGGDPAAPMCVVASCDEGYVQINDFQCVDPPNVGCQPCADDAACFGGSCVDIDGESVCVVPCDQGACAEGFACEVLADGEERCMPVSASCGCNALTDGTTRPCQVANDVGVCVGQQLCDGAVGWGICTAHEASPEVCDGVDNDCNGVVDDDPEGASEPCSNEIEGVGGCAGVTYCLGADGLVCQAATPEPEGCDFQDNDCDGETDEDFKAEDGAWTLDAHCGTCGNACTDKVSDGVGTCGGSAAAPVCVVASCDEGFVAINDFQCAVPPDVACQACADDDDCFEGSCESMDGQLVCLMPCEDGACGGGYLCVDVAGADRCVPDSGSCACNASTAGQVRACQFSNDVGTCLGTETCDEALGWSGCTAWEPTAEMCDGVDNDCNGAIDDGLADQGAACDNTVAGVGTCQGVQLCQGQTGWSCQGPAPEIELC
ncbi:MAG: MopE-related protein, partial [Myxococcota bacterium]|nr:MopE-related protein [Myxococcota bacterium]